MGEERSGLGLRVVVVVVVGWKECRERGREGRSVYAVVEVDL